MSNNDVPKAPYEVQARLIERSVPLNPGDEHMVCKITLVLQTRQCLPVPEGYAGEVRTTYTFDNPPILVNYREWLWSEWRDVPIVNEEGKPVQDQALWSVTQAGVTSRL